MAAVNVPIYPHRSSLGQVQRNKSLVPNNGQSPSFKATQTELTGWGSQPVISGGYPEQISTGPRNKVMQIKPLSVQQIEGRHAH